MGDILLQQHFYASASLSLSGGRGFQTIAASPQLVEAGMLNSLEAHCRYERPREMAEED